MNHHRSRTLVNVITYCLTNLVLSQRKNMRNVSQIHLGRLTSRALEIEWVSFPCCLQMAYFMLTVC